MKYGEYQKTADFDLDRDAYCKHCLVPFKDDDELGRCEQTNHITHTECVKHSP